MNYSFHHKSYCIVFSDWRQPLNDFSCVVFIPHVAKLVAEEGIEPPTSRLWALPDTASNTLRQSVTVIYVWSLGRDLNPRINGFAIRAIEPLWYRDISSYVNTLYASGMTLLSSDHQRLRSVFAYKHVEFESLRRFYRRFIQDLPAA